MSLSLRAPRRDEAALVLSFIRELAAYEKLSHEVDATETMIAEALFCAQPRVFCEFAEWEGVPVGYALWTLNYSSFRGRHTLFLEDLYVQPEYRGRGIGKAMLMALAQRCVEHGWARFEWSVLDWNAPSIAFYRSMGATLMDGWTICRVSDDALRQLASRGGGR